MLELLTKEELQAFETDIADSFNNKEIRAPVHLYDGNEEEMRHVFRFIKPEDWVLCTWRSHYQCLLKGVPKDVLKQEILKGKSISLCFPEYKIFSSAIVGGVLPIAVGIALGIKRSQGTNFVYVFLGDMTSETGIAHECIKYSIANNLPVRFIIEDNGKSVCTDTRKTWGLDRLYFEEAVWDEKLDQHVYFYKYETKYPHAGAGARIQF
jgi:TPP-dependent pyruvate/acetoin dehydrogenase alpha subunit